MSDLVEVITLEPTLRLDVRYATASNFVGRPVYVEGRVFLQRPVAEDLVRVHQGLETRGLGLLLFDGYRPWRVTKIFWDETPPEQRLFVANPETGSRHNRGAAIDLSLFDRKSGEPLEMPSDFDEFAPSAYADHEGGPEGPRERRDLLRRAMEAGGFTVNPYEWWHFDHCRWSEYEVMDVLFSEIGSKSARGRALDG